MSAHEELVYRCAMAMPDIATTKENAQIILAEVFRTLETVTEEMEEAMWDSAHLPTHSIFLAILRASPLAPPKGEG